MAKLSQSDLNDLNETMESKTPVEVMRWAVNVFADRAAFLSSMQRAGSIACHMAATGNIKLKVYFVDTGVNFQETLDTRDRIASEYGLEVITLRPKLSMEEQTRELGILYLTPDGQQQCCELRKVDPLVDAADQFDALISGLRRSDGEKRKKIPILVVDPKLNSLRINALATFDDRQFEEYLIKNDVVVNPLHAQGYTTVGCNRCTTPVLPDEPKRAGRWRHLGPWSMYCGINPTDMDRRSSPSIDLPEELIEKILGRNDFVI